MEGPGSCPHGLPQAKKQINERIALTPECQILMTKKEAEELKKVKRVGCSHQHLASMQGGLYRGRGTAPPLVSRNVWIISTLGLLQMNLLWTLMFESLHRHTLSFVLSQLLRRDLQQRTRGVFLSSCPPVFPGGSALSSPRCWSAPFPHVLAAGCCIQSSGSRPL